MSAVCARIDGVAQRLRGKSLLEAGKHFADAVGADHHHEKLDPVGQQRKSESEAIAAEDRVRADCCDEQADTEAYEGVAQ